jgi:hypothetical protein
MAAPPLSPSRLGNATPTSVSLGAPTPRKRIVFEEDDDFFAGAALAEAEQQEEMMEDEEALQAMVALEHERVPVASTSAQPVVRRLPQESKSVEEQEVVASRPGVKEGKRRLVLEPEEGFGEDAEMEGERTRLTMGSRGELIVLLRSEDLPIPRAPPPVDADVRRATARDFTSRYADLPALNLNLRPGFIEAAPVTATTSDGRKITFARRKRLEAFEETAVQKVGLRAWS